MPELFAPKNQMPDAAWGRSEEVVAVEKIEEGASNNNDYVLEVFISKKKFAFPFE